MNRPFDEKPSFKRGLGYTCLLTLLVLLFYWEGLGAHLDSLDLSLVYSMDLTYKWYLHPHSWKPIWCGLVDLTYLSFDFNPLPFHIVNLVLYISILLLLYPFYNLFLENKTISKIAVLLFATFYIHAEIVTQFTSNRELLWTLFGLATLIYFHYYRKTHCLRHYVLALLFGVLTHLSEQTAVCLPLLLLAVDHHISHGVFSPKLLPLKDIGRGLLPHSPFWLMALAALGYALLAPRLMASSSTAAVPDFIEWSSAKTLYDILNQSYFLAIYTFAPCYLTDKLTIIMSWIIMGGIGWLFYRSTPQKRSLIVTMTACTGFTLIPYSVVGPVPRYFTFSSVFSMFLVTLLAFEIGSYICRLLEERLQGYRLSPEHVVTTFTMLILLPAIYLNYKDVRQYTKNLVYAGKLLREIVEGTVRILPQGPQETRILYLNLPKTVKSDAVLRNDIFVAYFNFHLAALDLYCQKYRIPGLDLKWPEVEYNENETIKAIYLELGYDRVSLDHRAWYDLDKYFSTVLSPKEFNALSRDVKNRILFFNPVTNRLEDVSGWTSERLNETISPYVAKLNYDPKNFSP